MKNSNPLFTEKSSKKHCPHDKNLAYNHKRICDAPVDRSRTCSYTKMIIESYKRLNKSQAIEFLQQASSIESKLSLLDAMKDKVTLSIEEIDELVPATDSSSLDTTEISSFDNLSYLSLFSPQQPSRYILNSFNNAALSSKMSSKINRRTAILRSLFGRPSSKRQAPFVRQPLRISQQEGKRRMISGGDLVRFSSTKVAHAEEPYQSIYQDEMYPQGNTTTSLKEIHSELQSSFHGLRYDFKKTPAAKTVNLSEIEQLSKDNLLPIPFTSPSSFGQGESLLSLSDIASMHQQTKGLKPTIQSAHSVGGVPNVKTMNNTQEKISFNAHQHKYHVQTPDYYYPKPLSTIELLPKQYPSFVSPHNTAGLFWYSANQSTTNRTTKFSTRGSTSNETKRFDSSSDSRDTSSSSSASSNNGSTKTDTSSSSSSTSSASSSGQRSSSSDSSSTTSGSPIEKQQFQSKGQYNRNQNDKDDLIHIDLNSITSGTSSSIKSIDNRSVFIWKQPNSRQL